ncbi:syntaxin-binding protein 5-like [Lingula anatina]|uniref:Syntaxin-binding protein 5-like n=1 Tax=Lingula anatina TaxID=7574 RepID=A0A1S3KHA4_LINAN|nr:syntaxin-binding protein 5-like [Lingula anatina]|eukprot:XP_013422010.1 syntaxin-binding protein 5-like [Lingula anatina]
MMKRTLKGVLENLRSTVGAQQKPETEIEETLRSDNFSVCKTVRHGFPYQPTALAYDPVQHLLAIGTKNGSLRMYPLYCCL